MGGKRLTGVVFFGSVCFAAVLALKSTHMCPFPKPPSSKIDVNMNLMPPVDVLFIKPGFELIEDYIWRNIRGGCGQPLLNLGYRFLRTNTPLHTEELPDWQGHRHLHWSGLLASSDPVNKK
jgi:hypothetical protein